MTETIEIVTDGVTLEVLNSLSPIEIQTNSTNLVEAGNTASAIVETKESLPVEIPVINTNLIEIPQGAKGTDGNTILYGTGAPANSLGVNGNFYIDTAASFIYGPKAAGAWPAGVSMIGPAGTSSDSTVKKKVTVASGSNINIASAPSIIGGKTMVAGESVFLFNQTNSTQNRVYDFVAVGQPLTPRADLSTASQIWQCIVTIEQGSYQGYSFQNITATLPVLGTTNLFWTQWPRLLSPLAWLANYIWLSNSGVSAGAYNTGGNQTLSLGITSQGIIYAATLDLINITASQVSDFAAAVEALGIKPELAFIRQEFY